MKETLVLRQHLARKTPCGVKKVLGAAHEACFSELLKTCKSLVPAVLFVGKTVPAGGSSPGLLASPRPMGTGHQACFRDFYILSSVV